MTSPTDPVLLDATRTPFGRLRGCLSSLSARQLTAAALRELIARTPPLASCDGVLLGQVLQAAQGQNPARQAAVTAGIDLSVPAATLNSVCLAGLATVCEAVRRIAIGEGEMYVVGGADSMTNAPHAVLVRPGVKIGSLKLVDTTVRDGLWCALTDEGMGPLSERANLELGIDREVQDAIALRSHERAAAATDTGRLAVEITAVTVDGATITTDEGIRRDATREHLAKLPPAFVPDGSISAGNASQMSDGASVGAVSTLAGADRLGRVPLARIVSFAEVAGPDNTLHLKPAAAIHSALSRAGLRLPDIDLFEINEAFAGVVAASCRALDIPSDVVNVNGGAIALGHPLGGTGLRLLLTLAHELARRDARFGVAALCGGGGQGLAVVIEAVSA